MYSCGINSRLCNEPNAAVWYINSGDIFYHGYIFSLDYLVVYLPFEHTYAEVSGTSRHRLQHV